jgi:hypothetical protein
MRAMRSAWGHKLELQVADAVAAEIRFRLQTGPFDERGQGFGTPQAEGLSSQADAERSVRLVPATSPRQLKLSSSS